MDTQRVPDSPAGTAVETSRGRFAVTGLIFTISGISALIYQVSWQRILALHSGVGIYSVAIIVSAFLAGLGLGSYWGGRLSSRMTPLAALRAFALLELGVGLFAAVSCYLYYDLLYVQLGWLYSSLWWAGLFHFLALVIPTTFMGMSLPFLVEATVSNPRTASRAIGYLYGLNVLGAALGALLTPWIFIRLTGVQGAVWIGAAGNLLAGLAALAVGAASRRATATVSAVEPPPATAELPEPAGSRPFGLWLGLYTLSGFCALSLEILWFRVMDVAVKSTAFTFGTVLAIYLVGLGVGSLAGGPLAIRIKRPLAAFLGCQCLLMIYTAVAVILLVRLPVATPLLGELFDYWRRYEEFHFGLDWDWGAISSLYLALPILLYGPPTVLMGISFAILQRAVHDDRQTSGLKVGMLQTGNIVGNVAGSLLTGLLLLSLLGTSGSLRFVLVLGLVFPVLGIVYYRSRRLFPILGLLLLVSIVSLPDGFGLWLRLHGRAARPAVFEEDATAVNAITPDEGQLRVSVNGKGHSWLPFGGIHSQLGALPAVVHPAPEEVAIIGLGSGDTAWAAACRKDTKRIRVFEISRPQRRLLARMAETGGLPRLTSFLDDGRVDVVMADGRNALAVEQRQYDLIEADALRPHSAYSGNLYSVEFFRLCAGKLKPGGLMCTWAPTEGVYRSFTEAFPHVVELAMGQVLIGSNEPIVIDPESWSRRLGSEAVVEYLGEAIVLETRDVLRTARPADPNRHRIPANHDLFPRDEFRTPAGY